MLFLLLIPPPVRGRFTKSARTEAVLTLLANLRAISYSFCVSNPRYQPRDFAVHPRDFGRRADLEWRKIDPTQEREGAQLRAAELQHRLCYGILELWMPRSKTRKITTLAAALGVPYNRLQRLLTGYSVMQFEDFGRFYAHIGPEMELWLLSGRNAQVRDALDNIRQREQRR